jgi:hypothetical protein
MESLSQQTAARLAKPPRKKNRLFVQSLIGGFAHRETFKHLETFCTFIGYPRSGHTLIGSLIDAHPNALVADELNALRFIDAGFSKNQVCYLMLRNSRKSAAEGREWTGYRYDVPGQWQGRFEKLRLIGDKMGGSTALRLKFHPSLLDSLPHVLQLKVKFIHVVRNPFDIISTTHKRRTPLAHAIEIFFQRCEAVAYVKSRVPQDVFELRHDAFVAEPEKILRDLCAFLGLSADAQYCQACASIVFRSPHASRHEITWPDGLRATIARKIESYSFLNGYSFDD